jgi:hypothetical protein
MSRCNSQGVCAIPPPPFPYNDTVFTRDYAANCPPQTQPRWNVFYWASVTPGNSDIKFAVATSDDPSTLAPTIGDPSVVPIGTASGGPTYLLPQMPTGQTPQGIFMSLTAAGKPADLNHLRLFADFQPTSDGTQVPTLNGWELQYDCVAAE